MTTNIFIEPIDVLYLRGNRLFQGAGAYGEALMPPWPSLAAGAIRSRMLADAGANLKLFANGERLADQRLGEVLGTPNTPGTFRITGFSLANLCQEKQRQTRQDVKVTPYIPLPSDVVVTDEQNNKATYLIPRDLPLKTSAKLPKVPTLQTDSPKKPITGLWLNSDGLQNYLNGEQITTEHLLKSSCLWALDSRLGIALDNASRTAATGMLYTTETVALRKDIGFLTRIEGADGSLPNSGLLRLGGDGRGATVKEVETEWPNPDWERIEEGRKFRIVLATPGIFPDGWRLPGCSDDEWWRGPGEVRARLVAATVSRANVISGWDLALKCPKTAQRAVPTGAVYWLENLEGELTNLRKLVSGGLWPCMPDNSNEPNRKAEGFNNIFIAAWPDI